MEPPRAVSAPSAVLALSFDGAASPSVTLKALAQAQEAGRRQAYDVGVAWYPPADNAAYLIRTPDALGQQPLTPPLPDAERFESMVFLYHFEQAAGRRPEETQPFQRRYAERDWTLVYQGEPTSRVDAAVTSELTPAFAPHGTSVEERVCCWLMGMIQARGARRLADLPVEMLYDWLRALNDLAPANLFCSDGEQLLVYQDRSLTQGLYWQRRLPPQSVQRLESDDLVLDLSLAQNRSRTAVMVSSAPLSEEFWRPMFPGQLLVLRQGLVRWNSHAGQAPEVGPAPLAPSFRRKARPQTLRITHETLYRYAAAVGRSTHLFRLRPLSDDVQTVLSHRLDLSPAGMSYELEDLYGNHATSADVQQPYHDLRIVADSLVRVAPPADAGLLPRGAVVLPLSWPPWQREMMLPYLTPPDLPASELAELADFARSIARRQDYDLFDTLADLNSTINEDFAYVTGSTALETTPFEVYLHRRGVCQDFANLLICLARLLGIPARYRVGYVYAGPGHQNTAQSQASHAWAELYLPEAGWRGFDPTNGSLAGADHVRVACGRSFHDAAPTSGTILAGGGAEQLAVSVRVELVE